MSPLPAVREAGTVVVCEDDERTLELLCDNLAADRFRPLPAPCASDALRLCHFNQPDLMLLDLVLPDAAGLDVLREIRECDGVSARFDPELPVIVLSGRSADADRVRGLTEGADGYLVKPFHYPELLRAIAAVLRRRDGPTRGPLRVGELVVDPVTREVRVGERRVELANKEFALLRALASEPTRVFTKQELLRDVWGFKSHGPHAHARLAREPAAAKARGRRRRRPVRPELWGVGYRLVEDPAPASAWAGSGDAG